MKLNTLIRTAATGAATAALYAWTALPSFAQDAAPAAPPPKLDSGDTAWMLTSMALVLMVIAAVLPYLFFKWKKWL